MMAIKKPATASVTLRKDAQPIEPLGLTLRETKQLLNTIQQRLLHHPVEAFLDGGSPCPHRGGPLKAKGYHARSCRTVCGTFTLASPRLFHCGCRRHQTPSFRPLAALLTASAAPELLVMETQWASLVSYGLTVDALTDFVPLDVTLDVTTVRHDTLQRAERCEAEVGEEQGSFIEGCPRDWGNLPIPQGPLTVGIAGGSVRDWEAQQPTCAVIGGTRTLAFKRDEDDETPSSKRVGFVPTLDTKSKRRLHEVLKSQGMQLKQQSTFLWDGSATVRDRQLYMSPAAEPIVAGFPLSMQRTVVDQYGTGLVHCEQPLGEQIRAKIERLKWSLWHGHLYQALDKIAASESLLSNGEEADPKFKQLLKAVEECRTSIVHNRHVIPNQGERYRHGEAIATGCVESTVHQVVSKRFCKKPQMQWAKRGAHLLLQTRVTTLN
jgi:hypothetical protein